jgi:GNAT superfamily N-acetyltransferase
MRKYIDMIEGYHDGDEVDMEEASEEITALVKQFAEPLPITVELRPYYRYEVCQGVILTDLYANEPGQGAGSKVMKYMCDLAHDRGVSLYTDPEGPRSLAFYEKFGFEHSRISGGPMLQKLAPIPDYYYDD